MHQNAKHWTNAFINTELAIITANDTRVDIWRALHVLIPRGLFRHRMMTIQEQNASRIMHNNWDGVTTKIMPTLSKTKRTFSIEQKKSNPNRTENTISNTEREREEIEREREREHRRLSKKRHSPIELFLVPNILNLSWGSLPVWVSHKSIQAWTKNIVCFVQKWLR